MSQTKEPATSGEAFWSGFLSLFRALILGRRLPPDQLRTFLLFAEPVAYLSAEQIAEALSCDGHGCDHEPQLPQGWSEGVSINDPESGDYYDADAQIVGEMLISLLRKEQPQWEEKHWKITTCSYGYDYLSYRVLDERGKVHPIACWMEGKLKLLRDGGIKDEAARRSVICRFIANTLYWLYGAVDSDEIDELPSDTQEAAAKLLAFFQSRARAKVEQREPLLETLLERCAEHIFDTGEWEIDEWIDGWTYAPLLWQALLDLGYVEAQTHTQTKSLFAA